MQLIMEIVVEIGVSGIHWRCVAISAENVAFREMALGALFGGCG